MVRILSLFLLVLFIAFSVCNSRVSKEEAQLTYTLPPPKTDGNTSVEKALANRRSHRNFQNKAISTSQLSQILWAAYGNTSPNGLRTAPSAGALYPLEVYAVVGNVEGIKPGVYRYISREHKIVRTIDKDVRIELCNATANQRMVRNAPASVVYSAVFSRTTDRYGKRGHGYVHMELGHSSQNIYLQAEALQLGTCAVGAFIDSKVSQVLKLPANEEPLYIMPIGYYE